MGAVVPAGQGASEESTVGVLVKVAAPMSSGERLLQMSEELAITRAELAVFRAAGLPPPNDVSGVEDRAAYLLAALRFDPDA